MLGNEVTVHLSNPPETVRGTLNQQTADGVWILLPNLDYRVNQKFYPIHRVIDIEDNGYRGR